MSPPGRPKGEYRSAQHEGRPVSRRLPVAPTAVLLRQLADGLQAGAAPDEVLAVLEQASSAAVPCQALLQALRDAAQQALPLASAFGRFPQMFSDEAVALLAAAQGPAVRAAAQGPGVLADAQAAGLLAEAIGMVAQEIEQRASLRRGLLGALAWPLFVGAWLVLMVMAAMIFVVPAFKDVFSGFGAELPAPTLLLIAASGLVQRGWWVLLLGGALAWAWLRSPARRRRLAQGQRWSRLVLGLPLFGAFLRAWFLLRLARLLLPVQAGRLPAPLVLAYLRASTANRGLCDQALALETRLQQGLPLADALQDSQVGGGDLSLALRWAAPGASPVAALQGALAPLEADLLRRRVRLQQGLIAAFYGIAGALVALFVVALYLPIFKLGAVV